MLYDPLRQINNADIKGINVPTKHSVWPLKSLFYPFYSLVPTKLESARIVF